MERAREQNADIMIHLGDVGHNLLKDMQGWFIVPGNHDHRDKLYQSRCTIFNDGIIALDKVTIVTKSLGRFPIAMNGYKQKLTLMLIIARTFGKPIMLLSHCGGKIPCHKRFLRMIEKGHAQVTSILKPDLEIHGHKHPSRWSMYMFGEDWWPIYNKPYEGDNVWNAALNILVVDLDTLQVSCKG